MGMTGRDWKEKAKKETQKTHEICQNMSEPKEGLFEVMNIFKGEGIRRNYKYLIYPTKCRGLFQFYIIKDVDLKGVIKRK